KARADLARARNLFAENAISKAELDQAQASADAASAEVASSEARVAALRARVPQKATGVDAQIEQAQARARTAHAQVATAQAPRGLAALDLSYTKIRAPQDGTLSKKSVAVGQVLAAGQPIGQLVPAEQVWVTANFKETQLARMRVGQPVDVSVDAFGDAPLHG